MMLGARGIAFGWKRKQLPYDAEVEYLESSTSQYIKLNMLPKDISNIKCSYCTVGTPPSDWWCVFGVEINSGGWKNFHLRWGRGSEERMYMKVGDRGAVAYPYLNLITSFEMNLGNGVMNTMFNGTSGQSTYTSSSLASISIPVALFGMNSSSGVSKKGKCRIYSFSATGPNGKLCDLIPVRFTNESGQSEGAMYDRLGIGGTNHNGTPRDDGLYRNQGTGAFIVGADVSALNGGGIG